VTPPSSSDAAVGNGELLSNQTPAANYAYTYRRTNAQGKPIIEQVRRGTDTAFMENDATGTPVMIRTSAGMQALYVYDNSGSPVALITSANTTAFAYSFDPYGTATTTTTTGGNGEPQTPFLYTGGLNDRTTGFTLDGARYYNPAEGRWTQNDTLDTPLDPNNANRYAYAADNPINFSDPTGRYDLPGYCSSSVGCYTVNGVNYSATSAAGTDPNPVATNSCVVGILGLIIAPAPEVGAAAVAAYLGLGSLVGSCLGL